MAQKTTKTKEKEEKKEIEELEKSVKEAKELRFAQSIIPKQQVSLLANTGKEFRIERRQFSDLGIKSRKPQAVEAAKNMISQGQAKNYAQARKVDDVQIKKLVAPTLSYAKPRPYAGKSLKELEALLQQQTTRQQIRGINPQQQAQQLLTTTQNRLKELSGVLSAEEMDQVQRKEAAIKAQTLILNYLQKQLDEYQKKNPGTITDGIFYELRAEEYRNFIQETKTRLSYLEQEEANIDSSFFKLNVPKLKVENILISFQNSINAIKDDTQRNAAQIAFGSIQEKLAEESVSGVFMELKMLEIINKGIFDIRQEEIDRRADLKLKQLEERKKEMDEVNEELEGLKDQLEELKNIKKDTNQALEKKEYEIKELKEELELQQKKIEELNTKLTDATNKIQESNKKAENDANKSELEEQNKNLQKQNEELNKKIQEYEEKITKQKNELENSAKTENEKLTQELERYKKELTELKNKINENAASAQQVAQQNKNAAMEEQEFLKKIINADQKTLDAIDRNKLNETQKSLLEFKQEQLKGKELTEKQQRKIQVLSSQNLRDLEELEKKNKNEKSQIVDQELQKLIDEKKNELIKESIQNANTKQALEDVIKGQNLNDFLKALYTQKAKNFAIEELAKIDDLDLKKLDNWYKNTTKDGEIAALYAKLKTNFETIANQKTTIENNTKEVGEREKGLNNQITDLRNQINTLNKSLETQKTNYEGQINTLKADATTKNNEYEKTIKELNEKQSKEIEEQKTNLQKQNETAQNTLKEEIKELEKKKKEEEEKNKKKIEELEGQIQAKNNEIASLKKDKAILQVEKELLQKTTTNDIEGYYNGLKQYKDDVRSTYESHSKKVAENELTIASNLQELNKVYNNFNQNLKNFFQQRYKQKREDFLIKDFKNELEKATKNDIDQVKEKIRTSGLLAKLNQEIQKAELRIKQQEFREELEKATTEEQIKKLVEKYQENNQVKPELMQLLEDRINKEIFEKKKLQLETFESLRIRSKELKEKFENFLTEFEDIKKMKNFDDKTKKLKQLQEAIDRNGKITEELYKEAFNELDKLFKEEIKVLETSNKLLKQQTKEMVNLLKEKGIELEELEEGFFTRFENGKLKTKDVSIVMKISIELKKFNTKVKNNLLFSQDDLKKIIGEKNNEKLTAYTISLLDTFALFLQEYSDKEDISIELVVYNFIKNIFTDKFQDILINLKGNNPKYKEAAEYLNKILSNKTDPGGLSAWKEKFNVPGAGAVNLAILTRKMNIKAFGNQGYLKFGAADQTGQQKNFEIKPFE